MSDQIKFAMHKKINIRLKKKPIAGTNPKYYTYIIHTYTIKKQYQNLSIYRADEINMLHEQIFKTVI